MDDFLSQFRETDFRLVALPETLNRLPVGVRTTEGKILRDIEYRSLDRTELKKVWDRTFAKNHPLQAIVRIMALVIKSIGGEPVYEAYAAGGFRVYPDILLELPLADTSYALVGGHIHNFGYEIKRIQTQCLDELCEKKQMLQTVSLKELMVEYSDESFYLIDFELPEGFAVPKIENEKQNIIYPRVSMRIPVVRDSLKYEKFYRANNQGDFYERIYGDCLEELRSKDGGSLEPERLRALGTALLKKMSALDSSKLEGALNNVPTILMLIQAVCQYCSEDLPVFIQQSFLFPKRR